MHEAAHHPRTKSPAELLEAWGDVVPASDWDVSGNAGYGMSRLVRPSTTLHDRSNGRFLPVYQTEFDLACIRAMGRTLAVMAPGLVGGVRNMCNYTIGKGFGFTATKEETAAASEEQAAPVLQAVQREIDYLLDDNDFVANFDREIHDCSVVDGESLLELRPRHDGRVRIYRHEPDELRMPYRGHELHDWMRDYHGIDCDAFVADWGFGVLTQEDAPDEALAYHLVIDDRGANYDVIRADRMVHIKRNVTRNAKRGFSDFYPIEADSTRAEKLRRNMAEGAAIQAAIAYVKEFVTGTNRTTAESILGNNATSTTQQQISGGSRTQQVTKLAPGTALAANGWSFKPGPMGSERASDFMVVAGYVQRMQAVRWSMPEYMFSGDASNANYASTMEATSPFVKACEAEQRFYSGHFVNLIWKALKIRWECGAFEQFGLSWEQIEALVKIKAECPTVAIRDPLKNIQVLETELRLGITSPYTAATEQGRDLDAERALGARPEGGAIISPAAESVPGVDATNLDAAAVADTAFNGAQVTSMVDIITKVSAGELPAESAIQAMIIAFPTVSPEQARSLVDPAAKLAAAIGVSQPVGDDGQPIPNAGGELVGMKIRDVTNIDKLRKRYLDAYRSGEATEAETRLALDGLGITKEKADLYLDANPANDPADEPVTESLAESIAPLPIATLMEAWKDYP